MRIAVPGDKSITQRALILSALADGDSRLRGVLPGEDPAATASILRHLGVAVPPIPMDERDVVISGVGVRGLRQPEEALDCGNSGTAARLILGVLAGQLLEAVVTGDESLRSRPMDRVVIPLERMGARIDAEEAAGKLPLRIRGGDLDSLEYRTPVASAQVKSAILLAGLAGGVPVVVIEPRRSRDHTERLFRAVGITVNHGENTDGWEVRVEAPPEAISPLDLRIPGDFSSAAFLVVLGLLSREVPDLLVSGVGLNETRTGLLGVLERMGASLGITGGDESEPVGDIEARPTLLRATDVGEAEIPGLIDEIPILAVAASRAEGVTTISGAGELRVKESDRITALCHNLRAVGVEAEEMEDGLEIRGSDRPARGAVRSLGDHRIAMAFGVLAALPGNRITIDDTVCVQVSFPGFWDLLREITGREIGSS